MERHLKSVETVPCAWGRSLRKTEGPPLEPCPQPGENDLVVLDSDPPVTLHFCGVHMQIMSMAGVAKLVPPSGEH